MTARGIWPYIARLPLAARIGLSALTLAALAYWLLWSALLFMFRCGDTCSGDPAAYERWQYAGQLAVVVASVVLGLAGLVLVIRPSRSPTPFLAAAAAGGLVWVFWVLVVGGF